MEGKILCLALLFLMTWSEVNARNVVIFENSVEGPLLIKDEILNLASNVMINEEIQEVDFDDLVPEFDLKSLEQDLVEGLPNFQDILRLQHLIPRLDAPKSGKDFLCNTCVEISKQADQVISNPETLKNVETYIKTACSELPGNLSVQCNEMLQNYFQEAVSVLQTYLADDSLCVMMKLCDAKQETSQLFRGNSKIEVLPVPGDEKACGICEQVVGEALSFFGQNGTKESFVEALHKSCSKLGPLSVQCNAMVDYFAPVLFNNITNMSPNEMCSKIGLCYGASYTSMQSQKNNCDLCESAVIEIKTELKDPETKIKVIQALLDGCKSLPNYVKECKKYVFEYAPILLTRVERYLDSNDLCTEFHVCGGPALKTENQRGFETEQLIKLPLSESSSASAM